MIESGVGRTEGPEGRKRRREAWRPPEPQDGEVREPATLLGLVHAEPPEALVQVAREVAGRVALVVEDEHPDASGLAVADRLEADGSGGRGGGSQLCGDRLDLLARTVAQEGERDVRMLVRDEAAVGQAAALPAGENLGDVAGKAETAEEP